MIVNSIILFFFCIRGPKFSYCNSNIILLNIILLKIRRDIIDIWRIWHCYWQRYKRICWGCSCNVSPLKRFIQCIGEARKSDEIWSFTCFHIERSGHLKTKYFPIGNKILQHLHLHIKVLISEMFWNSYSSGETDARIYSSIILHEWKHKLY